MNDKLKQNIMETMHISEEEYWENLDIYLDNLLADGETIESVMKYNETHNPIDLTIKAEMRIAHDLIGGYRYGD